MSTTAAAVIVIVLLAFALVALVWQTRRALRAASARADRLIAEASARAEHPPAAPDNAPGINLADQDFCELTWSMPAYEPADPTLDAGFDRLRAAIRDEQQKGETA